jgi:hypothetical protein
LPLTSEAWLFENDGGSKDNNPNYLCTITCTDQNIQLVANLPQEYTTDISANYDSSFSQAIENLPIVGGLASKARMLGVQLTTQALTAKVWQGSSEITFTLPLIFQAIDNEYKDVLDKLQDLYRLTLPDELFSNGFLTAPGPRLDPVLVAKNIGDVTSQIREDVVAQLGSPTSSAVGSPRGANSNAKQGAKRPLISSVKNNISLQIGNYQYYESVVINNLGQTHFVQPLASGVMSQVAVMVTFTTFFTPVKADISRIFRGSPDNRGTRGGS